MSSLHPNRSEVKQTECFGGLATAHGALYVISSAADGLPTPNATGSSQMNFTRLFFDAAQEAEQIGGEPDAAQ